MDDRCVFVVSDLVRDFQHSLQRQARIGSDVGCHGDLVGDAAFDETLERPKQMLRINAEHRGAKTAAVIEGNNETIRILFFKTVHQMNFGADGPLGPGRRLRHTCR